MIDALTDFFSLQFAFSSYLGYPRINFFGNFRGDSNTRNNDICNYRRGPPNPNIDTLDWNVNGSNEFEFVNTKVISVVDENGNTLKSDGIIGRSIIGNLNGPIAKLSDGSSRDPEVFTIFGMKFGIKWTEDFPQIPKEDIAFHGDCSRSILTQFIWPRIPCYTEENPGPKYSFQNSIRNSPQYTSTISNIQWGNPDSEDRNSNVLSQLRDVVGDNGKLSMRIVLFYTTRNYWPYVARNATLGYVVGSIGPYEEGYDTENVPGRRGMFPKYVPVLFPFPPGDICSTYEGDLSKLQWTNFAPFEVGTRSQGAVHEIRLDLSNSLPTDLTNTIRDLGPLFVGAFDHEADCVMILNEEPLPYTSNDISFPSIFSIEFPPELAHFVAQHALVLFQSVESGQGSDRLCSLPGHSHSVQIILQEYEYFIRPMGYYVDFLEKDDNPSNIQRVYVTKYGEPVEGVTLTVQQFDQTGPPPNGVKPELQSAVTEFDGTAQFNFLWNGGDTDATRIPGERVYNEPPCPPSKRTTLPIDGQLYYFYYCVDIPGVNCEDYKYIPTFFLAFSDYEYDKSRQLTWVDDVGKILSVYARVSPLMTKILDVGNYTAVKQSKDIMTMVLSITDLDDPAYMPTTRDLSQAKRRMILDWLEDPVYDSSGNDPQETEEPVCIFPKETSMHVTVRGFEPPVARCHGLLAFKDPPEDLDSRLKDIATFSPSTEDVKIYKPLEICNPENVKKRLQTAVQLEWATIPVYLTSLYSIVDGCNFEIYELIWSVVIQEMLHMTQAANILIAMGGRPIIDNSTFTPSFPTLGLPGNVLPGLNVTLERLSLEHIHKVFMSIEVPEYRVNESLLTIGRFYREIEACIKVLDDKDFQSGNPQVTWAWDDLVLVNSRQSALDGINMIVSQGEGSGPLRPYDIEHDSYAHFFKFEEIVCGKRLVKEDDNLHYSYSGAPIPYEQRGVWPMRPSPVKKNILQHSNCYTESRAFHKVYRMLLRRLQEMFDNAESADVNVAIQLMEALEGHGKKLMWTKFHPEGPGNYEMCGPIWDYDWPEP